MPEQITDATIADNVREAASVAKEPITLDDLGARAGIADRTWWRRLTGRSPWLVSELIAVADVLGVDAAQLLERQKAVSLAS